MDLLQTALGIILVFLAVLVAAAFKGRTLAGVVNPLCAGLCVGLLGIHGTFLLHPSTVAALVLPFGLPDVHVHFRIDVLSAFFGIIINLGGMLASLYGVGYCRHEKHPERIMPFYAAFLAGMNLVVLADDAFTFLVAWELMSLVSWALVLTHHRKAVNRHAGYIYLLMANFGTIALLFAFGLMAGAEGHYSFDAIRQSAHSGWVGAVVLTLVLLGAGSKAGLVPVHVWLPLAHPAAPSHVSALLSGVMTKVAVYAFLRIVFDLLGAPEWWWGAIVLVLGAITALMGILYALMQTDLKRLLAYSTVENIGIIFTGLGLALAFKANNMGAMAALALTAALFHAFNHSLFKCLLFFGAGAVLASTGERDMEKLGGLIHRMKMTVVFFLTGCAAISALPPLNGFVSEWMTFQAILLSPQLPQWLLKFAIPAAGIMLALAAALAALGFVKVFGIVFLGHPRSAAAANAKEVDRFSLAAMGILASVCLLAGVVPGLFLDKLAGVVTMLTGESMILPKDLAWLSIMPAGAGHGSYSGLLLFLFIVLFASATVAVIYRFASRISRPSNVWDCGNPVFSPNMQYTASSFAQPIRRVFGTVLFNAHEDVSMPVPGDTAPATLKVRVHDIIWDTLYRPIGAVVTAMAERINKVQFLTIRRYLKLAFSALIILLVLVTLWHA